jgi:hypothetical protein
MDRAHGADRDSFRTVKVKIQASSTLWFQRSDWYNIDTVFSPVSKIA